jgi:hypothetical protein
MRKGESRTLCAMYICNVHIIRVGRGDVID